MTFCWIIYTAPDRPEKPDKLKNEPIKKINKSGSNSLNRAKQPIASAKKIEKENPKKDNTLLFVNSVSR